VGARRCRGRGHGGQSQLKHGELVAMRAFGAERSGRAGPRVRGKMRSASGFYVSWPSSRPSPRPWFHRPARVCKPDQQPGSRSGLKQEGPLADSRAPPLRDQTGAVQGAFAGQTQHHRGKLPRRRCGGPFHDARSTRAAGSAWISRRFIPDAARQRFLNARDAGGRCASSASSRTQVSDGLQNGKIPGTAPGNHGKHGPALPGSTPRGGLARTARRAPG